MIPNKLDPLSKQIADSGLPTIMEFCNYLGVDLYPVQAAALEQMWESDALNYTLCWGRRSGKTELMAINALYIAVALATIYSQYMLPGEAYNVVCIATKEDQARKLITKIKRYYKRTSIKNFVTRDTSLEVSFGNFSTIKAMSSSASGVRGLTCAAVIGDELAHLRKGVDESSPVDGDNLVRALANSTATVGPAAREIYGSSPWSKEGIFYEKCSDGAAGIGSIWLSQKATWEVNPTIPEFGDFLNEKRRALPPEIFDMEFGANFHSSFSKFLSDELVNNSLILDEPSAPQREFRGNYVLGLDSATGAAGKDSYTACIAHYDDAGRFTVDLLHQFNPDYINKQRVEVDIKQVEQWIRERHQEYLFSDIVLDQWNSLSTIQTLQKERLPCYELTWSRPSKQQAFSTMRELFVGNRIALYNHPILIKHLKNLAVSVSASGWTVSGGSAASSDDYAFALAASVLVAKKPVKRWMPPIGVRFVPTTYGY